MKYIIIQAGGKGTRLRHLTRNKPKALVPVDNLPMIFHLFRKYPDKRFIIIGDYKKDVLRKYLAEFATVKYKVVDAEGTGTCSGVSNALEMVPEGEPFMLIWSDLVLPEGFWLPEEYSSDSKKPIEYDYVGLSGTFPCRWKFENGKFSEERSVENGVAGFFLFKNKDFLKNVPQSGELVRWFAENNQHFKTVDMSGTREFGVLEEYDKLEQIKTRPFNRITVDGDVLTKEALDEQGRKLAVRECAWYDKVKNLGIEGIPKIYETNPLKMENIKGKNIYDCNLGTDDKRKILESLVGTLKDLHGRDTILADPFSMHEAYYNKTMQRLSKIQNLVPYAMEKSIKINDRLCRNIFYHTDELERKLNQIKTKVFTLIHGDCTFSNLMIRDSGEPVLIDPRGYFGFTELYGDERYDWAKLYYSVVGNYDKFNLKQFDLVIGGHSCEGGELTKDLESGEIRLKIESNGWENLEKDFFELTGADESEIKLLHAIIWLSLTTYAWQDYDSICGAFYNGLYYLEEVL
ncbi:sugar phosphate nucleotidyltransferase [Eubacterium xylanophilum]|uniref:sugar phosphate nucleotidyltransferase n=1 Tax=Eubacterium xylanophilum TaxID=39497 RepID=UPI00047C8D8A|nr:sugar phosphate nucleotidyltransferase [Eubacterium xylanophilum]